MIVCYLLLIFCIESTSIVSHATGSFFLEGKIASVSFGEIVVDNGYYQITLDRKIIERELKSPQLRLEKGAPFQSTVAFHWVRSTKTVKK